MAKRMPRRIPKHAALVRADRAPPKGFQAAALARIDPLQPKCGVARARAKHQQDNAIQGPEPQSLADRFHALPAEIRAHIFSLLLVQPVKWNLNHDPSCTTLSDPTCDLRPSMSYINPNPWRSKYAPEVRNDFMRSDTWDEDWRLTVTGFPFPTLNEDMPCLCARRANLDILLVCRKWHDEAAPVLWGSNTLAFEGISLLPSLAANCTAKDKITSISILECGRHHALQRGDTYEWTDWAWRKRRQALIASLRTFPALTHLELDAVFLHDVRDVRCMVRLGLRNLRSVRFIWHPVPSRTLSNTRDPKGKNPRIYAIFRKSLLLRGGLAEEVARAIKGQHRGWMHHHESLPPWKDRKRPTWKGPKGTKRQTPGVSLLQRAVERHVELIEPNLPAMANVAGIVNCDDVEFWAFIFWKTNGKMPRSQSYLPVNAEIYHPVGWAEYIVERDKREAKARALAQREQQAEERRTQTLVEKEAAGRNCVRSWDASFAQMAWARREREWREVFPFAGWEV